MILFRIISCQFLFFSPLPSQIHTLGSPFLNISCGHIQKFDPELYRQLICYPQEVIPTLDMAVNELFFEKYPDMQLDHQIQVKIRNEEKVFKPPS